MSLVEKMQVPEPDESDLEAAHAELADEVFAQRHEKERERAREITRQAQVRADNEALAARERERAADPARCTLVPLKLGAIADPAEARESNRRRDVVDAVRVVLRRRAVDVGGGRVRLDGASGSVVIGQVDAFDGGVGLIGASVVRSELDPRAVLDALTREVISAVLGMRARSRQSAATEEEDAILAECSIATLTDVGEQAWVVDGVLPAASLTLIVGASGGGKTFAAMSVAVAVAAGARWLDHAVGQGRVVLVLLEGSDVDFARRLRALAAGFGTTVEALEAMVLMYRQPLKTDQPESLAAFARFIGLVKPRLVVIDNLSEIRSSTSQGSENDAPSMRAVLGPLAAIAQGKHPGVPATAIALIHHSNASGGARGGDGVKQHSDHILELDRASDRNDSRITIRRGKARSGGGVPEFEFRFRDRADGAIVTELVRPDRDREPDAPAPHRDQLRRDQLLELLPLGSEELYAAMSADHSCGRTVCKRVRDQLAGEGAIAQRDGVWGRVAE